MIWYFILKFIASVLGIILSFFPVVTELPLGMDGYLSTSMNYFRYFAEIVPPFALIFNAFLFYMYFKIIMLTLRVFKVI